MKPHVPPTLPLFDLERLDGSAPATVEDVEPVWWVQAVDAVMRLAATGVQFQAYDLVTRGLAEPGNPAKQWGALFAALRREGLIVPVGYGPSRRPTTRSSASRIWRGAA